MSNQSKVRNNVQGSCTEWSLQVDITPIREPHGWVRLFFEEFFFHLFYTCLLSLVYEVGCRAAKIFFFIFFFKTYMSIIKSQLFLTTQNVIRHFWYLLSFLQLSLHFKVFKALCEASVKILLHFVSISLILTNDWQLLQICKHLLTYSPCQWWVHQSLVNSYCLIYPC